MRKHKQPSAKQLKAIALLAANPRMTKTQAALEAGYKPSVARVATRAIFDKPLVKTWLDNYRYTLNQYNIHPQRLASKLDELLDASNPIITMAGPLLDKEGKPVLRPDRKIQLETVKVIHEVFDIKAKGEESGDGKLKRRMTIEEFEEQEQVIQGD